MAKYIIVLFISVTLLRMIRWANHRCNSIAAGVVTGATCFTIDALINWAMHKDWVSWLLAIFESILMCAGMILVVDLLHLLQRGHRPKETCKPVYQRPRHTETFAMAMEELSSTISDVADYSTPTDRKQAEYRLLMANQLEAVTRIMKDWDTPINIVDYRYRASLERLVQEARSRRLVVEDAHCFLREERLRLEAYVSSRYNELVPIRELTSCVKNAFETGLLLQKGSPGMVGANPVKLTWYEEPSYYTLMGIATQKKKGSEVSGDSFSVTEREDQTTHICISDGMGSGKRAEEESKLVVHLMDRLVDAGFDTKASLTLLNSTMVMCTREDSYSSLDYACLDLYEGTVELTKIGAAASFIKRDDRVDIIRSKNPPTGAMSVLDAEPVSKALENGDFLVMVTDGVIEYLMEEQPEEYLAQMIRNINTENASVFASTLMEQVQKRMNYVAKDDMTVLVVGIWRK